MQKKQTRSVVEGSGKGRLMACGKKRPQASGSPTAVRDEWQSIGSILAEVE